MSASTISLDSPKCHAAASRKVGHKHCSQKRFLRLAGKLSPTLQKAAIVTKNTLFSACIPLLSSIWLFQSFQLKLTKGIHLCFLVDSLVVAVVHCHYCNMSGGPDFALNGVCVCVWHWCCNTVLVVCCKHFSLHSDCLGSIMVVQCCSILCRNKFCEQNGDVFHSSSCILFFFNLMCHSTGHSA